jgi:hydrophobic/amphiphilic exporter-1 (mainly G- bacteria), HAE1 family
MRVAETFIDRPITTTLVMAAILIFGIFAYQLLPVSDLPNVDFPTIVVNANLPGAAPDTMATAVATPLEKEFSTIAGIDSMTSVNSLGNTQITVTFTLDRNIDAAAQDIQAAISKTLRDLPQDLPAPPSYQKVNPADSPVLYLAVSSPTLKLSEVDEYAETTLAQNISTVAGVAQVQVYGGQKYAVRVQLDPRAMATRKIGIDEVNTAIRNGNVNIPTGTLYGQHRAFTIQANGQLQAADEYRNLIVAYRGGSPVRLGELGNITDSVENDKNASWFNGDRAIMLAVQRQPGTNTVQVVDDVKARLEKLKQQLPPAVSLQIHFDRSVSIRESVNDVKFTLVLTIALVVMVIFLFLRNLSATVIPSLALPMSIVGTFSVMYLLGFSLDNFSLMALTLSVGFVVDDAIVMLENIVRHMEMGKTPYRAAMDGAREIGFTIISMTISLAAVFIPVLFMGGIIGRLLNEFAVTIAVSILVSGFVSLSLTPMLGSKFLRSHANERHGRAYQAIESVFNAGLNVYERALHVVMRHKFATFAGSMGIVALTAYLFVAVPKGFLPNEDIGFLFATTEGVQGSSFQDMVRHQLQVQKVMEESGEVTRYMSTVSGQNSGRMFFALRPRDERGSAEEIIQKLRPKLAQIPGVNTYIQMLPPIRLGGRLSKSQYQYTLQSPDTDELYEYSAKLEQELQKQPQLQEVTSDLQIKNPQVNVDIDRDKASALGITAFQVEDALASAYGSRQISTILTPTNQYRVVLELLPEYQLDPAALSMLYVRSSTGQLVPLNAVANLRSTVGPLTVTHQGQGPAVTLSFDVKPGVSLGEATRIVEQTARRVLPSTISTAFQGTAQAFQSSTSNLGLLLLAAIVVIYIVLGILYESFIHPITILSGLPSAAVGALLTLMLFRMELNLYGFVGVILLIGIVKKNAIMMIDFALDAQRKEGKTPEDAIVQGALVRFRPIMMTTAAALMGTLPIALGLGAGAESRRPLGVAVVGGLVFSQLVTLLITPVYYIYLERLQHRVKTLFGRSKASETELEEHAIHAD